MQVCKAAAVAALLALAGCTTSGETTSSISSETPSMELAYAAAPGKIRGIEAFSKQTKRVSTGCFPNELKSVLRQIHAEFGVMPVVTSGHRPRAGRSQHRHCRAADIRVPGVKPSRVAKFARTIKGIGGVGTYSRKSIVHVDVGPRRDWHH